MNKRALKEFLDAKVVEYNRPDFIPHDPLSIPHRFTKQQDIEIAGFFAALLAWGNRKSILTSCDRLMNLMDNAPYDFIMQSDWNNNAKIFNQFQKFVHRTFNHLDLFHLLNFLQHHFRDQQQQSLETAFSKWLKPGDVTIENALSGFHDYVFSYDDNAVSEKHCRKHIATPAKKSACKRLNMYLRWMVRSDDQQIDFGLWKNISPAQLVCPIDVHVARVAKHFKLLERNQSDWQTAMELTAYLRTLDPNDPVKYDFALFGLGVSGEY